MQTDKNELTERLAAFYGIKTRVLAVGKANDEEGARARAKLAGKRGRTWLFGAPRLRTDPTTLALARQIA